MATKGDVLRSELKEAIKQADFRESIDRPKTLKRPDVSGPKKKSDNMMGKDTERSLKNLKKEFGVRFKKEKNVEPSPRPRKPGEQKEDPNQDGKIRTGNPGFRSGGRAGYKAGSKGCKLAMKGKGRAYGKNS